MLGGESGGGRGGGVSISSGDGSIGRVVGGVGVVNDVEVWSAGGHKGG